MKNPFSKLDISIVTFLAAISTIIAVMAWIGAFGPFIDNNTPLYHVPIGMLGKWSLIGIDHIIMALSIFNLMVRSRTEEVIEINDQSIEKEDVDDDVNRMKVLRKKSTIASVIDIGPDGARTRKFDLDDPEQARDFESFMSSKEKAGYKEVLGEEDIEDADEECNCPACTIDRFIKNSKTNLRTKAKTREEIMKEGDELFNSVADHMMKTDPATKDTVIALKHLRRIDRLFTEQVKEWSKGSASDAVTRVEASSVTVDVVNGIARFGHGDDSFIIDGLSQEDARQVGKGLSNFNDAATIIAKRTVARSILSRSIGLDREQPTSMRAEPKNPQTGTDPAPTSEQRTPDKE